MSQIGNRLAGMSANNGTNPNNNSLYSNTNANNNSPQTNKNYSTSANALRQLYNNQPRDNSVTFNTGGSSPYSQPRHAYNSNPNTPMGAPNNGYGGMTGSQTTNFGGVNSNGGYAGHGGGPGGMTKNGISSNSSGNIPAYLQRQQMTNGANNMLNSGGFTGQSQHKMNNNSNNNIPSYLQQQNNSNKSISSNHGNSISSDLYSNGNNIYYAPNSNFTEKVVNFTEKATNELGKTARITKQWLNENYGKGYKTIDQEVHEKINRLKVDKEIYMKLMKLSKQCLEDQRKYMKSQTIFEGRLKIRD